MTKPFVRPDVQAFLDMRKSMPKITFTADVIAQMRNMPVDPEMSMDLPVGDIAVDRTYSMPGPGGGDIALRLFDARADRRPGPVVIFYHGGGFCLGSIESHASLAAEIARQLDLPVVSVEYRLAPENPWPAGVDDGEAAARWIAEKDHSFDRAFTSLIPCGDSAGGTLAILTTLSLRDRPAAKPVLMQIPIYPITDGHGRLPSRAEFGDGYQLDTTEMAMFDKHLAADPNHWRGSPLIADHAGLPPTLIVTAALDPLRDDGRAYAAALAKAGVQVTYREVEATIHGFLTYRKHIPSARDDLARIMALARGMIAEFSPRVGHNGERRHD